MPRPLAIAVFVSGEGTTLDGLSDRLAAAPIGAEIRIVLSDRPTAPALERARRKGIETVAIPRRGASAEAWTRRATDALELRGVELIVLAGFLSIIPPEFVDRWPGRIINLHPSLLPRFGGPGLYGARVHEAVLRSGAAETGVSVHVVTKEVDRGPVLLQRRVPVLRDDTPGSLRARLHPLEVDLLAEALEGFVRGRWPLPYAVPESE